jgi:UDP-N-acetylmuramate-alanine ligase
MELDHTDYYKDRNDYKSAFIQMNLNTKKETLILENSEKNTIKTDFSEFEKIQEIPINHFELDHVW